jgi:hypothetical protein
MNEIKYTTLYCVLMRTCVIPLYYGSGTVINYGSVSNFGQVTVPVPVPQGQKLRFQGFRFHNTARGYVLMPNVPRPGKETDLRDNLFGKKVYYPVHL